ncbi:CocE/NonD family hydrolase [Simkania negevensis]|uniref:CocE/NonD family hydrolase n=1 Tax=Simkania negevensis TaxID=83561 RepID=A0ABS3ASD4_9BACT|nr:CocE/NonD family hydrolase [Simkania negevensis]
MYWIILVVVVVVAAILLRIFTSTRWLLKLRCWYFCFPQPKYCLIEEYDIGVPMRDGAFLSTDVYRPNSPGEQFPVIITRTPYGKRSKEDHYVITAQMFTSQGYVFIIQDVRGTSDSPGEFMPWTNEAKDSHDTFEWASQQEWSSGSIGTFGGSYLGGVQWYSATTKSPYLKAMVPMFISQNLYAAFIHKGIHHYQDLLLWKFRYSGTGARTPRKISWHNEVRDHLPLITADEKLGEVIIPYREWILHPRLDEYWDFARLDKRIDEIEVPALLIAGWYDRFIDPMLEDFQRMKGKPSTSPASQSRIIIGPWTHRHFRKIGQLLFGADSVFWCQYSVVLDWFDHWLKGKKKFLAEDPINLFVMGANKWRKEKEWPLARTEWTNYYLHSQGSANTTDGDGLLNTSPPEEEREDCYDYDPADPMPSIGNKMLLGDSTCGPVEQNPLEERQDVLVYTSVELEEDIEVTGPIKAVIYASSSAVGTDFFVKIVNVYPGGASFFVQSGIIRVRYRNSLTEPEPIEPEKIYRYEIDVGSTSLVFKKRHHIRIHISSSAFPEFSRNLNTGESPELTTDLLIAHQKIFHNKKYPSHVILPVIPTR